MSGPWDASVYALHSLAFTLATDSSGYGLPAAGSTTTSVSAILRARASGRQALAGQAEQDRLELEGRCVNPMSLPAGVGAGSTAALQVGGRWGTLTLEPVLPSAIPEVEAALGQRIAGTWRSP